MSKITNSYISQSHLMPLLGVTPFEFLDDSDVFKN